MKRVGILIAQRAPGADDWVTIGGPTTEVGLLVDQVRKLPPGNQVVQILASNLAGGVLKRVKATVDLAEMPKVKGK